MYIYVYIYIYIYIYIIYTARALVRRHGPLQTRRFELLLQAVGARVRSHAEV